MFVSVWHGLHTHDFQVLLSLQFCSDRERLIRPERLRNLCLVGLKMQADRRLSVGLQPGLKEDKFLVCLKTDVEAALLSRPERDRERS